MLIFQRFTFFCDALRNKVVSYLDNCIVKVHMPVFKRKLLRFDPADDFGDIELVFENADLSFQIYDP